VNRTCILVAIVALSSVAACARVNPARGALRDAVDAKQADLDRCYADTLARDANAGGAMTLWLEVESDGGRVSNVEVERTDVADATLGECIRGHLATIQIAEVPPIPMRVQYQVQFHNAAAGGAPPPPAAPAGEPPPPPAAPAGEQPPPPTVPAGGPPPPPAVRGGGK
jgi:hypothetical protein